MQLRSAGLLCGHLLAALRPGRRHERGRSGAGQVPVRSVDAYFFQGRSIRNGESIRTGGGKKPFM